MMDGSGVEGLQAQSTNRSVCASEVTAEQLSIYVNKDVTISGTGDTFQPTLQSVKDHLRGANEAIQRVNKATSRHELIDAMRSVVYWTQLAEKSLDNLM